MQGAYFCKMWEIIKGPWPWYISGPIIGLIVPVLLLTGNKRFGISSSLRHLCAACIPARIPFFQYNWRKEIWNLFLVTGILIGGFVAAYFLRDPSKTNINPVLAHNLHQYGINNYQSLVPQEIFSWHGLVTLRGVLMMIGGGFLVGFGTRYAGGCTSGHSIMGISNLQLPSVIATVCFMIGGLLMTNFILSFILQL